MKRKILKQFEVALTQDEILTLSKKAADLAYELTTKLSQFKQLKSEWKGKIDGLHMEIDSLQYGVRSGKMLRDVEVTLEFDLVQKTVQYVNEKGEIMEERSMTDEELQMDFEDIEESENTLQS